MTKEVLTKEELFLSIDDAVAHLSRLAASLNEKDINQIPYQDSWTAGQLLRHVTKSTNGMAKAMLTESTPAERDSSEKVHELRKTFLNFSLKMQSPEFIVPENEIYQQKNSIDELNSSFKKLKDNNSVQDMNDLVEGLPFGPTTKIELLHFVLYHTERHLHQMRKICEALKQ